MVRAYATKYMLLVNYTCDDGWRLHKDHCYLFAFEQSDWYSAEAFCQNPENGACHLISIHDEAEQSFVSGK